MTEATKRPLVQVEKLSKLFPVKQGLFGKPSFVHAVDGVSFYVRRAETLGLVGESGCGKTTLGRSLIRLIEPTLGRVLFDGKDLTKMPEPELRGMRRRMQIVFQDPYSSLNPRMTVREIVGEGIAVFDLAKDRAEADEKIADVLQKVGLRPDMMGRYPHEFSGGQRQRIGIARALAVGPEFIVCDEPVSALDVSVQAQVLNLLEDLKVKYGLTLIFIAHELAVVKNISDRGAVMYLGKICEVAPSDDLYRAPAHHYTQVLLNSIPVADPTIVTARTVIEGEPPSSVLPPPGCRFHPRCPAADDTCRNEEPKLREIAGNHFVACHHPIHGDAVPVAVGQLGDALN